VIDKMYIYRIYYHVTLETRTIYVKSIIEGGIM